MAGCINDFVCSNSSFQERMHSEEKQYPCIEEPIGYLRTQLSILLPSFLSIITCLKPYITILQQTTFLGSRALAGSLVRTGLLAVIDKNGQTLSQILMDNGANGEADVEKLSIAPQQMKAYIEIHSEQGPKLMQMGSPLAVVSGIAGQTFLQV